MKLKTVIKKKFLNADGTINKTVVASFITVIGIKWRLSLTRS